MAIRGLVITLLMTLGVALGLLPQPASAAEETSIGRETGLPLPRFVSLKRDSVNLRVGPGRKYAIAWQYRRRGLPVEVIQEFDQWRRIRDSEGATGWVLHSLLSSRRTALIAPWERPLTAQGQAMKDIFLDGKRSASINASTVARLQAGLLVDVEECLPQWCAVKANGTDFWLTRDKLWGIYPDENVGS